MTSERSPRRRPSLPTILRLGIGLVAVLGGFLSLVIGSANPAGAARTEPSLQEPDRSRYVNIIEMNGWIDPASRDFLLRSIDDAVEAEAQALIVQLDSPGSLLPQSELDALESRIRSEKRIAIAVWVGGGAKPRAYGGATRLLAAADVTGLAAFAKIGKSTPTNDPNDRYLGPVMNFEQAKKAKAFDVEAPILVEFVGRLDGLVVDGKTLETAEDVVNPTTKAKERQPYGARFAKMNVLERLAHMAVNPSVAYFLFVVALALFVFEFFTGGIGIAAVVGLGCFVLAVSGLGTLPTRPLSIALLVLAMVGFAIDIQAGTPRVWTGIATVSLVVGSVLLYGNGIRVPWFAIALTSLMVVLFMVNGMPTMVRTRFATPTIGRESMIGEVGVAKHAVDPDGVVQILGAPWKARTNRATPIAAGEGVRVVAIDGLLLEVEPLEGGAKDARH